MIEHNKENGGSAFPVPYGPDRPVDQGMTLRDYFAAAALPGVIRANVGEDVSMMDNVQTAFMYADAMLEERDRHAQS